MATAVLFDFFPRVAPHFIGERSILSFGWLNGVPTYHASAARAGLRSAPNACSERMALLYNSNQKKKAAPRRDAEVTKRLRFIFLKVLNNDQLNPTAVTRMFSYSCIYKIKEIQ
jgi:hypothetical protein